MLDASPRIVFSQESQAPSAKHSAVRLRHKIYSFLLRLQSKAGYWILRQRVRRLQGGRRRLHIRLKTGKERLRDAAEAFRALLRQAGSSFLAAVLLATAILYLEGTDLWLRLERAVGFPNVSRGAAARLYGTLASLAGLFVSLYFTAVGFLTNALYAGASRELRATVLREQISTFYIRLVLGLGALSLFFLAAEAIGHTTRALAVLVTSVTGIFALFGAGSLLGGTLRFFNPANFAADARRALSKLFGYLTPESTWMAEPSVQGAVRERAREALGLFDEARRLCESEELPSSSLEVGQHTVALLNAYWNVKPVIGAESAWWQPSPEPEDWFLASKPAIDAALQRGTSLKLETAPDRLWVERALSPAVARTLGELAGREKWSYASQLLGATGTAIETASEHFFVAEGAHILSNAEKALLECATQAPDEDVRDRGAQFSDVWDALGAAHVQLMIGARRSLRRIAPDALRDTLADIDWGDDAAVSASPFMPDAKERLETLGATLRFERAIEGSVMSPAWYRAEFLLPDLLGGLHRRVEQLEQRKEQLLEDAHASLSEGEKHFSAAHLARRGLEIQRQWSLFVEAAKEMDEQLRSVARADEFELPTFDWKSVCKSAQRCEQRAIDRLLELVPTLLLRLEDSRSRDLIGHIYTVATDRCAATIVSGEAERFSDLFHQTFNLGAFLWARVPLKDTRHTEWNQARIGVQPALDLMALSGLALARDEVDGPGFWQPVRETWNYFMEVSGVPPRERIEQLLLIGKNAATTFGVPPRSTIRTGWRRSMSQNLRERGFDVGYHSSKPSRPASRPLLAAILSGGHQGIERPIDIFLGAYVAARSESAGLELPSSVRSFLRRWTGKSY